MIASETPSQHTSEYSLLPPQFEFGKNLLHVYHAETQSQSNSSMMAASNLVSFFFHGTATGGVVEGKRNTQRLRNIVDGNRKG